MRSIALALCGLMLTGCVPFSQRVQELNALTQDLAIVTEEITAARVAYEELAVSTEDDREARFARNIADLIGEKIEPVAIKIDEVIGESADVLAEADDDTDAMLGLLEVGLAAFGIGGVATPVVAGVRRARRRQRETLEILRDARVTMEPEDLARLDPEVASAVLTPPRERR